MRNIRFYNADIAFLPKKRLKLRNWLNAIASEEKQTIVNLNYVFCSDEYLYNINVQFLNHDDYTDVITFDNSAVNGLIEGEIYISCNRIKENAQKYNSLFIRELHRVMAHGLLHLLGYNDKGANLKAEMILKEDFCLNLRPQFNL